MCTSCTIYWIIIIIVSGRSVLSWTEMSLDDGWMLLSTTAWVSVLSATDSNTGCSDRERTVSESPLRPWKEEVAVAGGAQRQACCTLKRIISKKLHDIKQLNAFCCAIAPVSTSTVVTAGSTATMPLRSSSKTATSSAYADTGTTLLKSIATPSTTAGNARRCDDCFFFAIIGRGPVYQETTQTLAIEVQL